MVFILLYRSIDTRAKRQNNLKVTRCGKAKLTVGILDDQNIHILNLDEQYFTLLKKRRFATIYVTDGGLYVISSAIEKVMKQHFTVL